MIKYYALDQIERAMQDPEKGLVSKPVLRS